MTRKTHRPTLRLFGAVRLIMLAAAVGALLAPSVRAGERFVRGDSNLDGRLDIADPVSILDALFSGTGSIECGDAADVNDDGKVDLSDSVRALAYLFLGARAPARPFPRCGVDLTLDRLGCRSYPAESCPPTRGIAAVLGHCGGVPETEYPNSLEPGDELRKLTLDDPEAVCNDGSPGILWIRSAPEGSPNADDWVIYLQGGGCCSDWESCRDRWCGRESRLYDEAKMSSRYAPASIGGAGIFSRAPENAFGEWNQVYVYYCSSDGWSGQNGEAVLEAPDGEEDYRIAFQGHNILREAVRRLLEGAISDDGVAELPPLSEARMVILGGSSAGANGVTSNGDWFASQLDSEHTRVRLVRDAALPPRFDLHPDSERGAELAASTEALRRTAAENAMSPELYDAFLDESCLAHAAGAGVSEGDNDGESWRCFDAGYVASNHLTTPFFQRLDLRDPTPADVYSAIGVERDEYVMLNRITLDSLQQVPVTAVEAADIDITPGTFGPTCGQHIALANDSFARHTISGPGGTPRNFHDVLVAWLRGRDARLIDDPRAPTSSCGPARSDAGE